MPSTSDSIQGAQVGMQYGGLYGAAGGAIDGYFGGPIFKAYKQRQEDLYTYPQLQKLALESPTVGLDQWLSQIPYSARLNTVLDLLNSQSNEGFRKTISSVDPNLLGNAAKYGENNAALLRGDIPKDVLAQIGRSGAYRALAGGYGGSPMAFAGTARDLGLTSLDLQKQGGAGLQQQMGLALALNPYHQQAPDLFTAPQALLQREDQESVYNTSIANQQKALDYASNLAINGDPTALNAMVGGMYGGGGSKPASSSGGMDMSSIMKMFGSSGGGGGGTGVASGAMSFGAGGYG